MEDKIDINFNWLKSLFEWIKKLFLPRFEIIRVPYGYCYDKYGREVAKSHRYVIYRKCFLKEGRYLDFSYPSQLNKSFNGDIFITYYYFSDFAYKFDNLADAERILDLIKNSPERFKIH